MENATVVRRYNTAQYSCNKGFKLEGSSNITCKLIGNWSRPPLCLPATPIEETSALLAPLLSVFVILVIIITVTCIFKLKAKRTHGEDRVQMLFDVKLKEMGELLKDFERKETEEQLKRNREFDAFVLYHFDSDDDFVINRLVPELEETRDFKLCIHSRNFTPGRDIKDNIEDVIEVSNSAIIIMSQGFVDSMWCKEEFTHCYIENMKDAAFNLFVIMMQPAETLINISNYMKTFLANKTYLQKHDPDLFSKLATYLQTARQQDDENDDNGHGVDF